MLSTHSRPAFRTNGAPDDLVIFQARMASSGIQVRLPAVNPNYELSAPLALEGSEALSETVIRLRTPLE